LRRYNKGGAKVDTIEGADAAKIKASLLALGVKERAIADPSKVEPVEDKKAK